MKIETYNRNSPFAVKLDASSSDRIITIFEPSYDAQDAPYLKSAEHVILNGFIKTLRAKSDINSLPETVLPDMSIEQSRTQRLNLLRNVEWTSPRKELRLYLAQTINNWHHVASVSLLNVPPYRLINLMEFYTENIAIELGATGAIGVSMANVGHGLLSGSDEVVIYGAGTTEVVVIPSEVAPIDGCTPHGWTITPASQVILPAQAGRKQITLSNKGPGEVYLNVGAPAVVGSGIYLAPNGGSYEFNRSNHPFNLALHAVASADSQLSGLVCL